LIIVKEYSVDTRLKELQLLPAKMREVLRHRTNACSGQENRRGAIAPLSVRFPSFGRRRSPLNIEWYRTTKSHSTTTGLLATSSENAAEDYQQADGDEDNGARSAPAPTAEVFQSHTQENHSQDKAADNWSAVLRHKEAD